MATGNGLKYNNVTDTTKTTTNYTTIRLWSCPFLDVTFLRQTLR